MESKLQVEGQEEDHQRVFEGVELNTFVEKLKFFIVKKFSNLFVFSCHRIFSLSSKNSLLKFLRKG
jgi:hypothetical protein